MVNGHENILFDLFVIFAAAKIAAEIFERLKQPAVVGEILAGVLIGPSLFNLVKPTVFSSALSEMGVILLLFTVGLEIHPSSLLKVGKRSFLVAIAGVIFPFLAGWGFLTMLGQPTVEGVFVGAALVATSVGITARVLASMNRLSMQASQVIMAAAVIDDILGLLVLSFVSSFAKGGVNIYELFLSSLLSIGFVLFMIFVGSRVIKKSKSFIDRLHIGHSFFIIGLFLCFGLSWLATIVGVAAIIGAFLAGMALSEASEETSLRSQSNAVMEFLVPFFLVGIGLQLDLSVFKNSATLILCCVVTFIAVATKFLACGLAALPMGKRDALRIGMGMVPRGEVGIIVAQIGLGLGTLNPSLFGVIVFMAVATTLITPPFLKILFKEKKV